MDQTNPTDPNHDFQTDTKNTSIAGIILLALLIDD